MNFNTSLAKSFFKSANIRSDPAAIEKFKKIMIAKGTEIAKNAAENARVRMRKTVSVADLDEVQAFEDAEQDGEEPEEKEDEETEEEED